jgi:hypothetical protein
MDEYLGLPPGHSASFALFLRRHLVDRVPVAGFYPVPGHPDDVETACRGYELLLRAHPVDVCCLGIGENGHIAFNDPPYADFEDPVWVKPVALDEVSRQQQVGEGHYASLDEVPTHALTMTIPALRAAREMICIVPETRSARRAARADHGHLPGVDLAPDAARRPLPGRGCRLYALGPACGGGVEHIGNVGSLRARFWPLGAVRIVGQEITPGRVQ